jgi:hypothetical protein
MGPGTEPTAAPVWWAMVGWVAGLKVAFQLVTAGLYGAHRDEFYYLEGGHHLAWGYVDHPPMVPALDRLGEIVFGHSVPALHTLPALIGGLFVVVGALLARELGGGRFAQGLTALITALAPLYLATSRFLSTVTLDVAFWAVASLMLIRLVRTGDRRLWLGIGVVVGLGLLNKDSMAFWVFGAGVGLLATPQRRLLASRWAIVGAAVSAVLVAPNVVWEIQHHWATLEFLRHIQASNAGESRGQFLPLQVLVATIAGTVVWVVALVALARDPAWRSQRWLAVGYGALFVLLFVSGGKAYYLASWYLPLIGLGAVVIERRWSHRGRVVLTGAVVLTGLLFMPLFTPVLPEATLVSLHLDTANADLGGLLGWPHVVSEVASAYRSLPTDQRGRAKILTGDYSEAGAVDFYGPDLGLPEAISAHNSFWLWGYGGPTEGPVIVVGYEHSYLEHYWRACRLVTTLGTDGVAIDPHERGNQIFVCTGQRAPWSIIWPQLRHYD